MEFLSKNHAIYYKDNYYFRTNETIEKFVIIKKKKKIFVFMFFVNNNCLT